MPVSSVLKQEIGYTNNTSLHGKEITNEDGRN